MMNRNLVMLSYGRETEYQRAIFCILSFAAWYEQKLKDTRINVYTDQPDFFRPFLNHLDNVEYILLTAELMTEMLDGTDYIHRRKVSVIDMTFKRFPNEDLVFIDSDTFFISGTNALFDGYHPQESFMHRFEYTLGDGLKFFGLFNQDEHPKAFMNYISGKDFTIKGQTENFTEDDYCWNSGVLGLSKSFADLLPDVYQLTDKFYENSRWFISEQLAFGLILQRFTKISSAESFVVHYWGKRQKILFDQLLKDLFQKMNVKDLIQVSFIKDTTNSWNTKFEIDLILEQATIALSHQDWKHGIKKSLQAIFKGPFNAKTYKELYSALKPV